MHCATGSWPRSGLVRPGSILTTPLLFCLRSNLRATHLGCLLAAVEKHAACETAAAEKALALFRDTQHMAMLMTAVYEGRNAAVRSAMDSLSREGK